MRKIFFRVLLAALTTLWVHALVYSKVMNLITADHAKAYSEDSVSLFIVFVFYGMLLLYLLPIATFHGMINHFKVEKKVYSVALSTACFGGYGFLLFLLSPDPKGYLIAVSSWLVAGLTYGTLYTLWLSRYVKFWNV